MTRPRYLQIARAIFAELGGGVEERQRPGETGMNWCARLSAARIKKKGREYSIKIAQAKKELAK